MSCLIYAANSSGCTGKCDANCYDAVGGKCDCICGGKNHGVGLSQAKENTVKLANEWIEEYRKDHPEKDLKVTINDRELRQFSLFEPPEKE